MEAMVYPVPAPSQAAYLTLVGIAVFLAVFALGFAWLGWSMNRVSVSVTDETVELRAPFYGRVILRDSITTSELRVVDLNSEPGLNPGVRTNGVGLPGFLLGWFRLDNGERALIAVTDRGRVVYVPYVEGLLLVSVADPAAMLDSLFGGAR
tara:strand:+ start:435 stop:887 length:453 start_codon:yes stop_codon:yes gene_type:complete